MQTYFGLDLSVWIVFLFRMTSRLGGWQRLWVVLTIAWTTFVVGAVWIKWPAYHEYVSMSPWAGSQQSMGFYEVLTAFARNDPSLSNHVWQQLPPIGGEVPQLNVPAVFSQEVDIPGVGRVAFPTGMSDAQVTAASKMLYESNQRFTRQANESERQRVRSLRWRAFVFALFLTAIPSVALYGGGVAARWVYRGFKTS